MCLYIYIYIYSYTFLTDEKTKNYLDIGNEKYYKSYQQN